MVDVIFLPSAEADYQQALNWYRSRSAQAAAGFEAATEVALQRIRDAPEQWPYCDERHRFYILRRYPYCIVYRFKQDHVLVVAVADARRDLWFWQTGI